MNFFKKENLSWKVISPMGSATMHHTIFISFLFDVISRDSLEYDHVWNHTSGNVGTSSLGYKSFARERFRSSLSTHQPWKEIVQFQSLSIPANAAEAFQKTRTHAIYFRINYIIVILFILFVAISITIPKFFTICSA